MPLMFSSISPGEKSLGNRYIPSLADFKANYLKTLHVHVEVKLVSNLKDLFNPSEH
jgi:hypothetical protein